VKQETFGFHNIQLAPPSFLLDEAVVEGAVVATVVVVTEHISISDKGIHTGDAQHALITHTDFDDGHPEPLDVHTSNNEHGGAGAHTLEPDDVLNE
jgi:hypothetical protein